ncbi:antibiotic biosynthesis monooxygenase [Saccharopolyspora indica]|uniref:antibiotic biosynthesis monooxygenase family protein n=1 Tax=Saccharopolyspora indica TaxID=1229659 RepID=UPI0022EA391C|nr:antibiotic biosynthesis monooxygenase [Saccharopolyspora indica]MDA3647673.1 antibiotic biosynthesis monooxygenase [Saccharopolyspora indica]
MPEVRVLIYHQADDAGTVEGAYREVSRRLAEVPGMLGNELLHSAFDRTGFVVLSRWADLAAFQEWERGAEHRDSTAPLRPFRDTRLEVPFGVYEVRATY